MYQLSAPMSHPLGVYFYISLNTSIKHSKIYGLNYTMTTKRSRQTRPLKYDSTYRDSQRGLQWGDFELNPGPSINFKFSFEQFARYRKKHKFFHVNCQAFCTKNTVESNFSDLGENLNYGFTETYLNACDYETFRHWKEFTLKLSEPIESLPKKCEAVEQW